ncbi:MAG TPA: hypothetical protein VLE47_03095 [Candidatus Saccharimonadales bacterium]|nr:hypothetical protein [Candidatus Saccharimonadales bacterium]
MPKYILPLDKLQAEDSSFVGETLSALSFVDQNEISLPKGFLIGKILFEEIISAITLAVGLSQTSSKDLTTLLKNKLELPDQAQEEITHAAAKLKYPLVLKAFAKGDSGELKSFESLVFSKSELPLVIKNALLSAFSKEVSTEAPQKTAVVLEIVEKVAPEVSGKVITIGHKNASRIYAQWGEYRLEQTSDSVIFNPSSSEPESYNTSLQERQIVFQDKKFKEIAVGKPHQFVNKLTPEQVKLLVKVAHHLSSKILVDFEFSFAFEDEELYLLDLSVNNISEKLDEQERFSIPLINYLTLKPLFPGLSSGFAKFVTEKADLKKVRRGDIAILKTFDKKYLPILRKSSGVIVENTKSLSREQLLHLKKLGKATLTGGVDKFTNRILTIDGKSGKVYLGAFPPPYIKKFKPSPNIEVAVQIKSATSLFAQPKKVSDLEMLTSEDYSGIGPIEGSSLISSKDLDSLTVREKSSSLADISDFLMKIASENPEKPVIYQLFSIAEPGEVNLDFLKEEAEMIENLRNKKYLKNLWVSAPHLSSLALFEEVKKVLKDAGLTRGPSFKLLLGINLVATATKIEDYIEAGIDGVVVDYYDLASFVYGKEFTQSDFAKQDSEATLPLVGNVIKEARLNNLFSAVSNLPLENHKLVEKIISLGVKAVVCPVPFLAQANIELSSAEANLLKK